VLDEEALVREVRVMTDHLTDQLFAVPASVASTVRFPISRLVVDPERFESDDEELMAARGMGVVYERTSEGTALRRALMSGEREHLLDQWYRPHHQRLAAAVDRALERTGGCLLIDAHSFPSSPLPYELDQEPHRPDICIGTDPFHTPPALVAFVASVASGLGWTVGVDRPFSGALVPMPYYGVDRRVSAIMIEVNRRLYLDEPIGCASSDFERCQNLVQRLVQEIINATAVGRA